MPIEQIRAFVGVAVAAEHQVHPMALQNRVGILAHLFEFGLRVRIVRALAVGRMVPVGNEPLLSVGRQIGLQPRQQGLDRKSTRLNSSHVSISYAVFCLKKKKKKTKDE